MRKSNTPSAPPCLIDLTLSENGGRGANHASKGPTEGVDRGKSAFVCNLSHSEVCPLEQYAGPVHPGVPDKLTDSNSKHMLKSGLKMTGRQMDALRKILQRDTTSKILVNMHKKRVQKKNLSAVRLNLASA